MEWCGPRPRIHGVGMEGLSSIGCQEAVFPATRGLVSRVWRTIDSEHCLATKRPGVSWRYGQMLLVILVSLCGSKGQKEILTLTVFLDLSDTKHIFSKKEVKYLTSV